MNAHERCILAMANKLVRGAVWSLGWGALAGCAQPPQGVPSEQTTAARPGAVLSRAEASSLSTVKPPGNPRVTHFYISPKSLAKLPVPQQPDALARSLAALQVGSLDARQAELKAKVVADMVFVRGGSFMRGDFAKLMGMDGVSRMTAKEDDKVVKEVTLSDFWISKYKVTYAEFDVFTDATGRPRTGMEYDGQRRHPAIPARAYWQDAKSYCQWLGQLTGLPMDLPTEAQWEYAARSRGQFFMVATDDGNVVYGRNVPYGAQTEIISPASELSNYPVGLFPANPLGLFDMSTNGVEWVDDWYAEDTYSAAPSLNTGGPPRGTLKVVRSGGLGSPLIGSTVHRYSRSPTLTFTDQDGHIVPATSVSMPSLRCAVTPP